MNAAATALSSNRTPRWMWIVLALLVVAGAGFRLYYLSQRSIIDYDGVAYALLGVNWIQGEGYRETEGTYQWYYPPFYPVQVGLASLALNDPELSGRIVSLIYGIAFPALVFVLTRRLFDPWTALTAAALSAFHPRLIDSSAAVLCESSFAVVYFATAYLGYLALRRRSLPLMAATAVLGALSYLNKPAAIPLLGLIGLWLCARALLERWGWRRFGAMLGVYAVLGFALCVPWLIHLKNYYGRWTTSELVSRNLYQMQMRMEYPDANEFFREYQLRPDGKEKQFHASPAGPPERLTISQVFRTNPSAFVKQYVRNFLKQGRFFFEGIAPFRVLLLVACLASPLVFWRDREKRLLSLFGVSMFLPLFIFPMVYVSLRYVVPLQPFVFVNGAAVLLAVAARVGKPTPTMAAAGMAVLLMTIPAVEARNAAVRQPAERAAFDPIEFKRGGEWILEHYGPDRLILTYTPQLAYYAKGRSVVMPYASVEDIVFHARHKKVDLAVFDTRYLPDRRKPVAPLADPANAPEDFRVVYRDETPGRELIIYELIPLSPDGAD